jgi:hypothetical protein
MVALVRKRKNIQWKKKRAHMPVSDDTQEYDNGLGVERHGEVFDRRVVSLGYALLVMNTRRVGGRTWKI